ncbi:hypothetical protein ACFQS3_13170 [Glycomyces mayteni]|uniref:Uncharacterized protein n=1 Tax=Glycomyces mayteni TaxID=543887 RepID=A0ABW2D6X4_9ACTN
MSDAFPPGERVELVARAVLLRAGLARFHEERRANWDRLTGDRTPSVDDPDAVTLNTHPGARTENADDLRTLGDALRLMDRVIDLLESPAQDIAVVAYGLEQLQHTVIELEEYADLKTPLALLSDLFRD